MERTSSESPGAVGPLTWRKRHPVLARVLLYGIGAALAAVAVVLLVRRGEVNRGDHVAYLAAELDGLPILLTTADTGAKVMLEVLEAKFSDPDLPAWLQSRVERTRALVFEQQGDHAAAEGRYEAALAQAPDAPERAATLLERAEFRLRRKDAAGARRGLDGGAFLAPLDLYRDLVLAQVSELEGKPHEGVRSLDAAMDGLPRLLPGLSAHFGGQTWTYAAVAVFATGWLEGRSAKTEGVRLWKRVLSLAPGDFDAVTTAARGLARGGHVVEAQEAWKRARRLDPPAADRLARADPTLKSLEAP